MSTSTQKGKLPADDFSDTSSDTESSAGWDDAADVNAEDDVNETSPAICLFCKETRDSAREIFRHCEEKHNFDWKQVTKDLDFYSRIKLVNYIRSQTATGTTRDLAADASTLPKLIEDEKYLQPFLEDDTLLFSLDDEEDEEERPDSSGKSEDRSIARIRELEEKLLDLTTQFKEYKEAVSMDFTKRLESEGKDLENVKEERKERDDDTHYFDSYAYNDIHEIMLKDTVRTDAYRDFIYGNKHLFKDKVVLDVGCGTGVLSMFAARAGAKKVISVDNSNIIDKARANVFANKLDGVITCLRGKIEEVTLPVDKVDIIVSEWMGYCLLYEAMLDSVLYARDRYLAPDGLMVPSECKILIAAINDSEYVNDNINFWNHVYGFNMTAMKDKIRDNVDIIHLPDISLASEPVAFCHLPLHTVKTEDLEFTKPFQIEIKRDIESLDGFLVYFDNFFATSRNQIIPDDVKAETWKDPNGGIAFTTGPKRKETHWRQGFLVVDEDKSAEMKAGDVIKGDVTYRKREENSRAYDIEVAWEAQGKKNKQLWFMK
ncbi:S-adenosyl-L-methionine-dependent methyltransferase [Ascodesmis nigricans]|uniref:type I protein arginine methyltransferase n=1 Tax=Ascodesmis nigricans TaxID=341454 RepID=A0A4S2MYQ4_9PEZI|nr:S-adenosyl-L-methionine-dependent methyltransferase [Ascodesmis nigricans]